MLVMEDECDSLGGTFHGLGRTCDLPTPCEGACCTGASCTEVTLTDCTSLGGRYAGVETTCADTPDHCIGACCIAAGCLDFDSDECDTFGGLFSGLGSRCADMPDPCSGPTVYESIDASMIVDAANAVGTASVSPYEHVPGVEPVLFYQVDDGAGVPDVIKLVKGGSGILINF